MAFVRKKGKSFYLVHNVREENRVRQVHLACLGNRPRVGDEIVAQVRQSHPQLQIDWDAVRGRAAESFTSPFQDVDGAQQLIKAVHGLQLDLRELQMAGLRERLGQKAGSEQVALVMQGLSRALQELRDEIDAKLRQPAGLHLASPNPRQNVG